MRKTNIEKPAFESRAARFRGFFTILIFILCHLILVWPAVFLILIRAENSLHHLATIWGKLFLFLAGTKTKVYNKEKLYRDGPICVISNHQSGIDIPTFFSVLDIQFRWLSKASMFNIILIGQVMKGSGYIPVERGSSQKSKESLFKAAQAVRGGKSVVIFPEATFGNSDGTMLPFKKGAFILTKKAEVVIQPVTVWGSNRIVPDDANFFPRIYSGTIHFLFHDPIMPEKYSDMSQDELSRYIRGIIQSGIDKMRDDVNYRN